MFKSYFPIYQRYPELVYWDSAATGLKLGPALEAEYAFAQYSYANVHRGVYRLSAEASDAFEHARQQLAAFFSHRPEGTVFVRGATEGIHTFAYHVIAPGMKKGQNILISAAEHHANLLIWRELCREKSVELRIIPVDAKACIVLDEAQSLVDEHTYAVALTHASNVTGCVQPIDWLHALRARGIWVLLDGAQYAAHRPVEMSVLPCDAYVLSAHKLYGPNGIGLLLLSDRAREHAQMRQWGGGMVAQVKADTAVWQEDPWRWEAGTPHITGVIGFAAAVEWLRSHQADLIEHERMLFHRLYERMEGLLKEHVWSDAQGVGILAFEMPSVHPHDLATLLDVYHVAIRAGQHCATPLIHHWQRKALARVSIGVYNDEADVEALMRILEKVKREGSYVG